MAKLLGTPEIAERLGVSTQTVRRYISEGKIPGQRLAGGEYRVTEDALLAFLRERPAPGTPPYQVLAFVMQKGGVGKTTSVAAVGAAMADAGVRVLLVDWDPQASLTRALAASPDPAMYQAVTRYIDSDGEDVLALTPVVLPGGEHLIAGHLDLASVEMALVLAEGREKVLKALLAPLLPAYDVVLIDCPPTLGLLTINALVAAEGLVIPVTPETLAAEGLLRLEQTISRMRRRFNPDLRIVGVLPTMIIPHTNHHQAVMGQIETWANSATIPLWPAIPRTIKATEAAGAGVALTRYPGANGVADLYRHMAARLLGQEGADDGH